MNTFLIEKLKKYVVFLASQSPRRHQLLKDLGVDFLYLKLAVKEEYPTELSPVETAKYLSKLKGAAVKWNELPSNAIVITCDTVVVVEQHILGKPKDQEEAILFLKMLSGKKHTVISGLTVATVEQILTSHCETEVSFNHLTDEDIKYYVTHYLPLDKAGAYGIQEWIGLMGVEKIEGCFYNIIGLPTQLLWKMLENISDSD